MKIIIAFLILSVFHSSFVCANLVVNLEIPWDQVYVKPGEEIEANLVIYRTKGVYNREDFTIDINVLNESGSLVLSKSKSLALEGEVHTTVSFTIPKNAKPGEYRMEVVFEDKKSGDSFIVDEEEKKIDSSIMPIAIGSIFLVIILTVLFYYDRKVNKEARSRKIDVEDLLK